MTDNMINKAGHTPGPWYIEQDEDCAPCIVAESDGMLIARDIHLNRNVNQWSANGTLIAAAPELYEQLANALPTLDDALMDARKVARECVEEHGEDSHAAKGARVVVQCFEMQCAAARDALAKARGAAS